MSYILEALKKAEAERQQGQVPSLHVQPVVALPGYSGRHARTSWLAAAILLLVSLAGSLVWLKPWQKMAPPPLTQQATPSTATASPLPPAAPMVNSTSNTGATLAGAELVVVTPVQEPAKEPNPASLPVKTRKVATVTQKEASPIPPLAPPVASPAQANKHNADLKLSNSLSNELAAASLRDLPEQIQRELPNISIGGYIYSDNQRERQLLVNKRLLREGEEAAPGLVLEQMLPKAAVFNYKGHRYHMPY